MGEKRRRQEIHRARLRDRSGFHLLYVFAQAGVADLFVPGFEEIQRLSTDLAEYHPVTWKRVLQSIDLRERSPLF